MTIQLLDSRHVRALRHALAPALLVALAGAGLARANTYVVDRGSASCSDVGAGTEAQPYCTIGAAVAAHNGAGTTIVVKAGVYREQVTVPSSGVAGSPFVLAAEGAVVVEGADSYGTAQQWAAASGTEWVAAGVTWSPVQVVVDGTRLQASTAAPGALAANTFTWVAGSGLYVNLGGDNPGTHAIEVGHRANGFLLVGRSYVSIEGFRVQHAEDRGIQLRGGCTNVALRHNQVTQSGRYGIQVVGGAADTIESNTVWDNGDHGIGLLTGVTGSTVAGNESYGNARAGGAATGIYVFGCPGNVLTGNRVHDNQDSGIQIQAGSNDCVSVQNRSWGNGDHGYHVNSSTGTQRVGDVAYGNRREGFLVESNSSATQLHDCIGVDNGLTSGEYDLWVDASSAAGLIADSNLWWNSTAQAVVKWGLTPYGTLAGYQAASGQEGRSQQADPRFVNAAAGDLRLMAGSPAIDAADAGVAGWPARDAEGRPRVDDPATVDRGLGSISYADLGALEATPPVATLLLDTTSGTAPLAVVADGTGSSDGDGGIVSYQFDFGDGTVVGPQAQATASHSYGAGDWAVTLTVVDDQGLVGSATSSAIHVVPANQPPDGAITEPASDVTIYAGQSVSFAASASDPDGDLPLAYGWDFGGGAAGVSVEDPGPVIFASAGSYTVRLSVTDARGGVDATPATRVVTVQPAPQGQPVDEVHWTILGQSAVAFDWRGFARTIHYGVTSDYSDSVAASTPSPLPFSSPGPFWEARIEGLQENTLYHYAIGSGADHTFRTPPPRGASGFTIYAEGDIGDAVKYWRMGVIQGIIAAGAPQFTLVLGDISYAETNGQPSVDQHFNDVMVWSQDAAYMPAWGNHEWGAPDDLRNYKGRFALPNTQSSPDEPFPAGTGEDWSWFDYGNVRFISYPDIYTSRVWSDWKTRAWTLMDQAQADPLITFIVTFGHRAAYSSGRHPSNETLQPILDSLGVHHSKYVLNLNGHSHNYERSYPQFGVTHVTSGGSGAVLGKAIDPTCLWVGGCPPPEWSAFRAMHHEALRLRITATGIHGEAICGPPGDDVSNPNDISCTEGDILDSFTIGVDAVAVTPSVPGAFGIHWAGPNPTSHGLSLSFSLEGMEPATLDVLDLAGRRILRRSLGALGPGLHQVRLARGELPAAGVYCVRLQQARRSQSVKIAVLP